MYFVFGNLNASYFLFFTVKNCKYYAKFRQFIYIKKLYLSKGKINNEVIMQITNILSTKYQSATECNGITFEDNKPSIFGGYFETNSASVLTNYKKTLGLNTKTSSAELPIQEQKIQQPEYIVPDTGTTDAEILKNAPNPDITIAGEAKKAVIVVDISKNVLYKYDSDGNPEIAYRIASGRKNMPTNKGVRIVSHVEKYPYKSAGPHTKRRQTPRAFGPYAIIVNIINPKTGEQSFTGEFIHGNNDANAVKKGLYASHGCMRMNNDVITKLKDEVTRGDIVIIK